MIKDYVYFHFVSNATRYSNQLDKPRNNISFQLRLFYNRNSIYPSILMTKLKWLQKQPFT